jgi:hypothetical protein
MSIPDPLAWLEGQAREWVLAQRAEHRPEAAPILPAECEALEPFFGADVLDRARCRAVPCIENPPFLAAARALGVPGTIDFTQMAGITFQDTILRSWARRFDNPMVLLFHELVHVVQYDVLGVDEFARQYVRGFAAGGFRYDAIPLERAAFECQARFEREPHAVFSVRDEIARHLDARA